MGRKGLQNERRNHSEGGDVPVHKLCDFPDSVLSHILSLLPTTEEAVKTSILSKRWKDLWTCVDTLLFLKSKSVTKEKMQFSQFVNRVLQSHKGSIKTMKLIYPETYQGNDYDLRNWTSFAIDRDVEILHLTCNHFHFRWPYRLFSSQTLVDLSICYVDISKLNIPSAPFFPSLRKLTISSYYKFDIECLKRLISGCLVLEDLDIKMSSIDELSLNLSSSTVKRLVIECLHCATLFNHKIGLDVPALEFLRIHCPPTELHVKDHLPSLTEVHINIFKSQMGVNEDNCCHSLVRLMEHMSNVKVLRLKSELKKPLTCVMHTKFPNLIELDIRSSFFEWPLLGSFMENSINLECITLQKHIEILNQVNWIDPQNVPHCLLSSLKKIYIKGYSIESALNMVKYVFKYAEFLEIMDIHRLNVSGDCKAQCEMLKKLVMFTRASGGCEVSFV